MRILQKYMTYKLEILHTVKGLPISDEVMV